MSPRPSPSHAAALSLRAAVEIERAKRDAERREREDAERQQQEADLARSEQLYDALIGDPEFLATHGLSVDWRRYTVLVESPEFRIRAYFEAGEAVITVGDKRHGAVSGSPAPRKSEVVHTVPDALRVVAEFLVDEIH